MALSLKDKYQIDVAGTTLYVTDITGVYDVDTNPGGWGDQNVFLEQSAVVALVQRVVGTALSSLTPISSQVVYDPTAEETKQTQFTFNTGLDGHIKVYLFRLPVSLDGIVTLESTTLVEGDYFYYNGVINQLVSGAPVVKTPEDLIAITAVPKVLCEDLMFPALAIKHNSLYQSYMLKRETDCDAAEDLFQEILHLRADLYGAKTAFRSGLVISAEKVIDSLLKKYDLTS